MSSALRICFPDISNKEGSISCFGSRCDSRILLPRKSAVWGRLNRNGVVLVILQKITMLRKSVVDELSGSSRKMRHIGKTAMIVRTTKPADGRDKSPA